MMVLLKPTLPDTLPADASAKKMPSEWGWIQRTFPYYQADADVYRVAVEEAKQLRAASKNAISSFGKWTLAGPTNTGGRFTDVEFDPKQPNIVYAGAATGGVFKSVDTGRNWEPIFDNQPFLSIGDIAVDPIQTNILYVGTGEANGGHNNFAGGGLYKSVDAGATWTFSGLGDTYSIGRILVDPSNPQRVFAAAMGSYFAPTPARGLYRSTNGGATWERTLFVNDSTGVIDVVMRPDNPQVLFAATWQRVRRVSGAQLNGPASAIYRSDDGGTTWRRLGAAEGLPGGNAGRIGLTLCRDFPNTMYALYNDGSSYTGFYRSTDGGLSWQNADRDGELGGGFSNFSWYFGQVRVDPTNPNKVFVMDLAIMYSLDAGNAWSIQDGSHVDHHALAFHPTNPAYLINGNDGGLAISTNGGQSWQKVLTLPVTQFYEITIDPHNPQRLYGGTQDNGTIRTTTGNLDDWQNILGGDGFYVIIDPSNSDIIYAESQRGALTKRVNGILQNATSGIPSGEPRNWSTPVAMDPNNAQVLYYGTNRLYRTTNGTDSWQPISTDLTRQLGHPLIGTLTTIAIAPTNSNILYVGTDDGYIWVSEDYGRTWRNATLPTMPVRWITRVVVDPSDDRVAYITYSGLKWNDYQSHIYRTSDRGRTWQDISGLAPLHLPDAPINSLAVDPKFPSVLYVGTDIGAFASLDYGNSWQPLGEGLPALPIYDLKIYQDASQRFLVAGTYGRSMHKLDISKVKVSIEGPPDLPSVFSFQSAYPNPFATETTLAFQLSQPAQVRLEVFDVLGRRQAVLMDGQARSGRHTLSWDAGSAPSGLYLARLLIVSDGPKVQDTILLTRLR